jgi:CheY-like chemotaxis protein
MKPVLVVDDKAENRYYLEALLRARGDTVVVARHGAEALVLARLTPPSVVI